MSTKIKRVLAVLLSAVMVLSTVMVTPAAPLHSCQIVVPKSTYWNNTT